ncbi:uncharacterized protein LOC108044262 [Drosophila rhopaloa]|uniref:Uncharacterized protein LOC108044262 n=1 Tax=Drosophila rhopaloa TaxID=1041015 RepID=A0A6P4EKE7_DRORH|nr:uncharacterized protein LOC108044262 [Drosophila rhopaloa]
MDFPLLGLILWITSVACQASEEIYQLLAKSHANQNLIVSPVSIEAILSMVYMGAGGSTARELQSALRLSSGDKQEVATKYGALLSQLQGQEQGGATLKLANRIYVNDQYSLHEEFNLAVREPFKAEAESISLANGPAAAARINQWVLDQTSGKIKNMIDPVSMTSDVKALLVNAIYFKGQWESKFDPERTRSSSFQVTADRNVTVPMMMQMGTFKANYFRDLDAQVLELPYRNSNLSMTIFLPRDVGGLSSLEEKIVGFARPLEAKEVYVKLPRFKIEFRDELRETLEKLGIRELFTDNSDLSGLFGDKSGGKVSQVSHKAFLEVNEEGAEAAAATSVSVTNRAGFSVFFVADHPFAFVIRDANTIFFQGRVVNPQINIKCAFGAQKKLVLSGKQKPSEHPRKFLIVPLIKIHRWNLTSPKATWSFLLLQGLILAMANTVNYSKSAAGEAQFASKLYGQLAKSEPGRNIVFSPSSIRLGLALAFLGADGSTAEELKQGLGLEGTGKNEVAQLLAKGQRLVGNGDENEDGAKLKYANRIYVAQQFQLAQAYQDLVSKNFAASAENVNFAQSADTAKRINTWVEEQTHQQIKNLIAPDSLDADTAAILVNAIYFKADWLSSFPDYATYARDFVNHGGQKVSVDTMSQEDYFRFAELPELKAKALELPYTGTDIVFLIILPQEEQRLGLVEEKLNGLDLNDISSQLSRQKVKLQLPKFKFEFDVPLQPVLEELGIKKIFSPEANLSSLLRQPDPIRISEVKHKAIIEVNEKGTTASGATFVKAEIESLIVGEEIFEFTADHPFFFAIKDAHSTFFLGHVSQL